VGGHARALTLSLEASWKDPSGLAPILRECPASLERLRLQFGGFPHPDAGHLQVIAAHCPAGPALRGVEVSWPRLERRLEAHHDLLTFAGDIKQYVAKHSAGAGSGDRVSIELLGRLLEAAPGLRRLQLGPMACSLHSEAFENVSTPTTFACAQCGGGRMTSTSARVLTSSQPTLTATAQVKATTKESLPMPTRAAKQAGKTATIVIKDDDDEVEEIDSTDDDDDDDEKQKEVKRSPEGQTVKPRAGREEPQPTSQQWNGFVRHKSFSFAVVPKTQAAAAGVSSPVGHQGGGADQMKKKSSYPATPVWPDAQAPNSIIMTRGKVPVSVRCLCTSLFASAFFLG
jgi:hypothetical protein